MCAPESHIPTPGDFPNFDNELRQAFGRKRRCSSRASSRRPQRVDRSTPIHVRQRALARHYGIPNITAATPPRDAEGRRAPRTARPGQHPDRDVLSEPHVDGAARQVTREQFSAHRHRRLRRTWTPCWRTSRARSRSRCARSWSSTAATDVRELSPNMDPLGFALRTSTASASGG